MKYYLIAGEASGDLHASRLMNALKQEDPEAEFRYYGGDQMAAQGGTLVKHYRELAYMGFIPVLLHLPTILRNMRQAKADIVAWQPDVLILVDYPGFNLRIAKFVKAKTQIPVYYYIAPKIWAWKEYRIKSIKRDVAELFSILPFEVDFFEGKHNYPIHYVGNPTADEVKEFVSVHSSKFIVHSYPSDAGQTTMNYELCTMNSSKPIVALLCGSRKQEIKDNLPTMLQIADHLYNDYTFVVAGAPAIERDFYTAFLEGHDVQIVDSQTYALLSKAHAALVTSGTATLETALFGVPQVVCYNLPLPRLMGWLRRRLLKVRWVSLVNLIANREVVPELVADGFSEQGIEEELRKILTGTARQQMLDGYQEVWQRLQMNGEKGTSGQNAARLIIRKLQQR